MGKRSRRCRLGVASSKPAPGPGEAWAAAQLYLDVLHGAPVPENLQPALTHAVPEPAPTGSPRPPICLPRSAAVPDRDSRPREGGTRRRGAGSDRLGVASIHPAPGQPEGLTAAQSFFGFLTGAPVPKNYHPALARAFPEPSAAGPPRPSGQSLHHEEEARRSAASPLSRAGGALAALPGWAAPVPTAAAAVCQPAATAVCLPARATTAVGRRLQAATAVFLPPQATKPAPPSRPSGRTDYEGRPRVVPQCHLVTLRSVLLRPGSPRSVVPEPLRWVPPEPLRPASPESLRSLSPVSLRSLSPVSLRSLSPVSLRSLSPVSLRSLSPVSLRSLSPVSLRSLSPVSLRSLSPESLISVSPETVPVSVSPGVPLSVSSGLPVSVSPGLPMYVSPGVPSYMSPVSVSPGLPMSVSAESVSPRAFKAACPVPQSRRHLKSAPPPQLPSPVVLPKPRGRETRRRNPGAWTPPDLPGSRLAFWPGGPAYPGRGSGPLPVVPEAAPVRGSVSAPKRPRWVPQRRGVPLSSTGGRPGGMPLDSPPVFPRRRGVPLFSTGGRPGGGPLNTPPVFPTGPTFPAGGRPGGVPQNSPPVFPVGPLNFALSPFTVLLEQLCRCLPWLLFGPFACLRLSFP